MRICLGNTAAAVSHMGPLPWACGGGGGGGGASPGDRGGGPDDRDLFHSALELLALALATVPTLRS